jgi:hypothetical protein
MWDKWLAWILYRAHMDYTVGDGLYEEYSEHDRVAAALHWWSSDMAMPRDYRALGLGGPI